MQRGIDLVFESDLPSAAGMSSSSALMIAVLLALVHANRLEKTAAWTGNLRNGPEDLAAYAATIENGRTFRGLIGEGGVGTEGGSEGHTAILCSEPSRVGVRLLPHSPRAFDSAVGANWSSRLASAASPRARPERRATTTIARRESRDRRSSVGSM